MQRESPTLTVNQLLSIPTVINSINIVEPLNQLTNWFYLTQPPLLVFPVTLSATIPHSIQAHSLFQTHPSCSHEPLINPVYHQKGYKPSASELTKFIIFHRDASRPKQAIFTNLQDKKLIITFIGNLSPTQPPNIEVLLKYEFCHGLELSSLQWEVRILPMHYRNGKSFKPLLELNKLTFKILQW